MGHEANNTGWDTSISAELIKKYGAVKSFEEAERLLEKEEEKERKLGKSNNIISYFHMLLICVAFFLCFHQVLSLVDLEEISKVLEKLMYQGSRKVCH